MISSQVILRFFEKNSFLYNHSLEFPLLYYKYFKKNAEKLHVLLDIPDLGLVFRTSQRECANISIQPKSFLGPHLPPLQGLGQVYTSHCIKFRVLYYIFIHISDAGFYFFACKPTVWGSPNYRGARLQVFSGHPSISLASQPP
ncbi:unnamed protein product [Gulo gulo]|uniref:Uncharacterized protein n=1 Tax=Gulo gulo TaxID=48420 RepID=A0A9X9Q1B9_GULGU|nr:unnamed protein product [Gulo gulo]